MDRPSPAYFMPNGYEPDGTSRPMVPVDLLIPPAPGSDNRIARVRRCDTGEEMPCPIYSLVTADQVPPTVTTNARGRIQVTDGRWRFQMTPTRHGSDRYGPCEICRQDADSLWIGHLFVRYRLDWDSAVLIAAGSGRPPSADGFTFHGSPMPCAFAHRACLERAAQRAGIATAILHPPGSPTAEGSQA